MILSTSPSRGLLLQGLVPFAGKPRDLVSSPGGDDLDDLERGTGLGALLRFGSGVFRRRPLIAAPPALERLFIASPRRLRAS